MVNSVENFLFFFERTLFDIRLQNVIRQLIQVRRAFLRAALAAVDLLGGHIVVGPVAATVAVVEQERLGAFPSAIGFNARENYSSSASAVSSASNSSKTAISPRFWSSGRSE